MSYSGITDELIKEHGGQSPLVLLQKQRSHVLFVLSNPKTGCESDFLQWYQGAYRQSLLHTPGVLSAQHYEQHEVDVTRGRYAPLPFNYLGFYELALDGAQEAHRLIELITTLHWENAVAQPPATWLYYPACEKVGRSSTASSSMLLLAFGNGMPGQEDEFREYYATCHIRHALILPVLVSGQCFERTQFQLAGALEATFATIAQYELEGTPEDFLKAAASLSEATIRALRIPMVDRSRFTEWVYRPL